MKIRIISIFAIALLCGVFAFASRAGFIRTIVFPVNGANSFHDDFGDPRSGGRTHEGVDIIAAKHTPVVAAVDGRIVSAPEQEPSYGYTLVLRDEEGYSYHYLHLNNDTPGTDDGQGGITYAYAPGITRGVTVKAGQHIGYVGDSGNAEAVGAHLHFELHMPDGTPIDPYESLVVARKIGEPLTPKFIIDVPVGGELIKYASGPEVYLFVNDTKYHITTEAIFNALGFSWNAITVLPEERQYRTGLPIEYGPNIILMRDGKIITISGTTTITPTRIVFVSLLSIGSRSAEVTQLQTLLKRLGYYTYTITGYYGTETRDAVLLFQKTYGIDQVGYVGPKTRAMLNSLL